MSVHYRRLWVLSLVWLLKVPSEYSMEVLEKCNVELTTREKRVREWMKDEEETPLYIDLEQLLDFIRVALDELDLLFLEERLGTLDEDEINDLVIHVDFVRDTYQQLLHF